MQTKADFRGELRSRVRSWVTAETGKLQRAEFSRAICDRIRSTGEWASSETVCAFIPMATEPDISTLWSETDSRRFVFPRLLNGSVQLLVALDLKLLENATWRMDAPHFHNAPSVALSEVDLLLVPGIAFTRDGERLGRGGGFYDRLLAAAGSPFSLGVCFDMQLSQSLPLESHDRRVNAIVTETMLYRENEAR